MHNTEHPGAFYIKVKKKKYVSGKSCGKMKERAAEPAAWAELDRIVWAWTGALKRHKIRQERGFTYAGIK